MNKLRSIFTVGLLAAAALGVAQAEPWAVKGNINLPFIVGGKALPAGEYTFIPDPELMAIKIEPLNGAAILIQAITRLATVPPGEAEEARIVFDKVGDTYTLSELWLPGEDGYLIHATKGAHEHHVLHFRAHHHR
jgi:hypothetical protein